MADADKQAMAKLAKIIEAAHDLHGKLGALLGEADALLAGKPSIAIHLKTLQTSWTQAWGTRYKGTFQWNYAVYNAAIKRWLKTEPVEEIASRMVNYIRDGDAFLVQRRHPFELFISKFNSYAGVRPESEAGGFDLEPYTVPAGCTHAPPCSDEMVCTSKRRREMRA